MSLVEVSIERGRLLERLRILEIINSRDWNTIFSTEEIVNWSDKESTRAIKTAIKREFGFE